MNRIDFIVTGTGRCGTVYLARLLTSLGISCGHESIFTCKGLAAAEENMGKQVRISPRSAEYDNWLPTPFITAEASYLSGPFLNEPILKDSKIIYLVRNPIRVIFSLYNEFGYFRDSYPLHCPEFLIQEQLLLQMNVNLLEITKDPILRAALFYVKWNEMIEAKCIGRNILFHRIEDDIQPVLNYIGKPNETNYFKDKRANTKKHHIFTNTIADVPKSSIKDMLIDKSVQYGYDLFRPPKPPRVLL